MEISTCRMIMCLTHCHSCRPNSFTVPNFLSKLSLTSHFPTPEFSYFFYVWAALKIYFSKQLEDFEICNQWKVLFLSFRFPGARWKLMEVSRIAEKLFVSMLMCVHTYPTLSTIWLYCFNLNKYTLSFKLIESRQHKFFKKAYRLAYQNWRGLLKV